MRKGKELPQFSRPIEDCDDHGIKKEQVKRSLCEKTEPEKNPRHNPGKPGGAALLPPAQPEDKGESKKRNVESLDFNEPALFNDSEIRQPNEGGEERTVWAEGCAGHYQEGDRDEKDAEDRWDARGPFTPQAG